MRPGSVAWALTASDRGLQTKGTIKHVQGALLPHNRYRTTTSGRSPKPRAERRAQMPKWFLCFKWRESRLRMLHFPSRVLIPSMRVSPQSIRLGARVGYRSGEQSFSATNRLASYYPFRLGMQKESRLNGNGKAAVPDNSSGGRIRIGLDNTARFAWNPCPQVRYKRNSMEEREAAVEWLREFLRFNYVTGTQAAQRIAVRDTTLYSVLSGQKQTAVCCCCADHRVSRVSAGGAVRHHADRVRVPGVQELARDSKAEALSVLQKGERRDTKGQSRVSRSLSELRSDGAEEGEL